MSRRPRLDFDFCPMPRRWHAAWAGASVFETGLRDRLYELNDGEPIAFEGDWLESLCRQASINGRERPPARKSMLDWQARGLLIVNGMTVWLCCRHDAQPRRPVVESTHNSCTSTVRPTHNGSKSNIQLDSSARNDSNHVGETDRQTEERERSDARARESSARFEKPPVPEAPPNTPPSTASVPLWLVAWPIVERVTDKAGMLGHPGRHQEWLQQLVAAAEREQTCNLASSLQEAVERLVRAWMADPWVIKHDADISNMAIWLRRRKPPTTKPIVKRVAERAPWEFDKESENERWIREADEESKRLRAARLAGAAE